MDQYAATLAGWFGVDAAGLAGVLPHSAALSRANGRRRAHAAAARSRARGETRS